jgi:hypothetical protein
MSARAAVKHGPLDQRKPPRRTGHALWNGLSICDALGSAGGHDASSTVRVVRFFSEHAGTPDQMAATLLKRTPYTQPN